MTSQVISGTVRNDAGRPVENARVYLVSGPASFPDIAALTDPDGRFSLSTPTPGQYSIACEADAGSGLVTVTVADGQETTVEFHLTAE
jgi:protocatechuate 3,4-dioxygenase beta subunit